MNFSQCCKLIVFAVFVSTALAIHPEDSRAFNAGPTEEPAKICARCSNVNLDTVCARVVFSQCSRIDQLTAQKACIDDLQATQFCVDSASFSNLCSTTAQLNNLCSNTINSNALCAALACTQNIWSDNSITGTACVSTQLYQCSYLSARAAVSTNTTYTLGTPINFDQIESDPSGSILSSPTRYKAPVSGTYILTVQINQQNLQGNDLIIGTPVVDLEVYVDGFLRRQTAFPYLTFNDAQSSLSSSLIFLEAGEELYSVYRVLVLDPSSGLVNYTGTVDLIGAPTPAGFRSFMAIHYLSSACDTLPCEPCPLTCIECPTEPCRPCSSTPCEPCISQELCTPPCLPCLA